MKNYSLLLSVCLTLSIASAASAGHQISSGKEAKAAQAETQLSICERGERGFLPQFPYSTLTVGGQFSDHMSGFYVDSITGLYSSQDAKNYLFLNSRYSYEDIGQLTSATGLGFRKMLPNHDVIFGVNGFYDQIDSQRGAEFSQFGFGAEILTKWVDARFNYYLPNDDAYRVERTHRRDVDSVPGGELVRRRSYDQYEATLEGFESEVGFLLPGLDRYAEVRLFAGYYNFDNPFGGDYEGFKARLEARLLPGLVADLAYYDDKALMGGHWTAGVRASVPFSLLGILRGRNPFAGFSDAFRPRQREFCERMGEMVIREHRVQTVVSDKQLIRDRTAFDSNGS
jgi:hypothetical protein